MMYIHDQEEKKVRDKEETRMFLKIQIEEARIRREKELKEAKEKIRTHFGPEEDLFTADFSKNLESQKKSHALETLQRQISENKSNTNTRKEYMRREELQQLAKAGEVMFEEHMENSSKDKGRKELFKKTWLMQSEVKRQEREINDELLRQPHLQQGKSMLLGEEISEQVLKPNFNTLLV